MRVTLVESGGWTNVSRHCSVDTGTLSRDAAERLEANVAALLTIDPIGIERARDAATLSFEIVADGCSRRLSFSEAAPPAELVLVLEVLRPLCRPVPNQKP